MLRECVCHVALRPVPLLECLVGRRGARLQIYDLKERGGMGMEHAYTYAAAALIDHVEGPQRGGREISEGGRGEQPSAHFEEAGMPK